MSKQNPRGRIKTNVPGYGDRTDSLFRVSLKALIYNKDCELLVVKEEDKDLGCSWWWYGSRRDFPAGLGTGNA